MILWAIWTQRNNVVLKNDKCNPNFVLELARKIICKHKKHTIDSKNAGSDSVSAGNKNHNQN